MQKNYKRMEHNEFLQHIDKLCDYLRKYIQDNKNRLYMSCLKKWCSTSNIYF